MKKFHRYKLVLDEGLPPTASFPLTKRRHDIKHIRDDFKQKGLSDYKVYKFAIKHKRLLVIYNLKDYRKLAEPSKSSGIIGISQEMDREQQDKKLLALLTRRKRSELFGNYNVITGETKT